MSNEILNQTDKDKSIFNALKNSLYPGAKNESILMVLEYCKAANLDPMLKPVHIVPISVKDPITMEYGYKDVIMPGIGHYRIQASRSGTYAGMSEPEFGDDVTEIVGVKKITYPKWCKVTVRKMLGTIVVEFTAKELWIENYAPKKNNDPTPNAMWNKRPYAQLAKCAEAQALRKAFPEIGSQPTAEEMEGKTFDADYEDNTVRNISTSTNAKVEAFKNKINLDERKAPLNTESSPVPDSHSNQNNSINLDTALEKINQSKNLQELAEAANLSNKLEKAVDKITVLKAFKDKKTELEKIEKKTEQVAKEFFGEN